MSDPSPPLRYAVLHHTGVPAPHFDILIEPRPGADLATWRSPTWPIEIPTPVERIKDHRRIYLDYEGDLGRRRGRVDRVAGGTCQVDVGEAGVWTITLLGGGVGTLVLAPVDGAAWELAPAPWPLTRP